MTVAGSDWVRQQFAFQRDYESLLQACGGGGTSPACGGGENFYFPRISSLSSCIIKEAFFSSPFI